MQKKKMSAVCHLSPPGLGDLWLLRGDRPSHKPFHYCLLLEEYICMYAYLPTYLSILVCTYTYMLYLCTHTHTRTHTSLAVLTLWLGWELNNFLQFNRSV